MRRLATLLALAPIPYPALANAPSPDFCFPKNRLHLVDRFDDPNSNINEDAFNKIISHVESYYKPLVAAHGATLIVERNWDDSTVNAYASREGTDWTVAMFGGLARREELTPDGFALVVCHEIGHHLGGFAFKGDRWAAAEGQSDYFATQACARKIWETEPEENARYRADAPDIVKTKCSASHTTVAEQDLCFRIAAAGKSLGILLAALSEEPAPQFETPDSAIVTSTIDSHPGDQCRLDTLFNGALCPKAFPDDVIPGFEHPDGQASIEAEKSASRVSCTDAEFYSFGQRPRCWFSAKLALKIDPAEATKTEVSGDGDDIWEPGETFGINIPLKNDLLAPVEGATLSLVDPLSTDNAVSYPPIPAGASSFASTAITVSQSADQACGSRFSILARVAVRNWSQDATLTFQLGRAVSIERISSQPVLEIPDFDPNGVSEIFAATSDQTTSLVRVTLDIEHPYVSDLQITLVSPSGKEYRVYDRVGADADNLKTTIDVPVTPELIRGDWKLTAADLSIVDAGKVVAWGLDFNRIVCDSGLQLLSH